MHNNITAEKLQEKLLSLDTTIKISRDKSIERRKQIIRKILTWAAMSFLCVLLSYAVLSSWKLAGICLAITLILLGVAGMVHIAMPKLKRTICKDVKSQLMDIQRVAREKNIKLDIPKNLVRYL